MNKLFDLFKSSAEQAGNWISRLTELFKSEDPLMILPYRGYANAERLFLKGRVLENEDIFRGKSDSQIKTILNSYKRFETDEIPFAPVKISINGQSFEVQTDEEGYFTLDTQWKAPDKTLQNQWLKAQLELLDQDHKEDGTITALGEIYRPSADADFGIITDVDDTILQTHVNSRFKLKMLYATFLQNADQRLPMEGIPEVFQELIRGGDGKRENPVFYVSNSPWNLYDLLEQFMALQELPKGPILLRDYGLRPAGDFAGHKEEAIARILSTYPDLPFLLLGDTASEDADIYLKMAERFPGQVRAIYIRYTQKTRNAERVAKLVQENVDKNMVLIRSSEELIEDVKRKGII